MIIYEAFIRERTASSKAPGSERGHELYFNPQCEDFKPRIVWRLSNAFTSAFKEHDPIPQFKSDGKTGGLP
jgi:hypothetical protein